VMTLLMEQQTRVPPPSLSQHELCRLEQRIQECLVLVQDLAVPDALGHLDLNPDNIITSPDRCSFLDWAEAYVGNPFFSFLNLLEHFRRTVATDLVAERTLIRAYAEQWERVVSPVAIHEGLRLSSLLAIFAYATGINAWKAQDRLREPTTSGYLRSLTRRMTREANQLSDRGCLCLR
jgi:aminoglycoside phosphotransferase (APT) family kinase protein